jgi:LacI family transcriptional regulator
VYILFITVRRVQEESIRTAKFDDLQEGGLAIAKRKEVAELAGVSEATVSRVLSGSERVKEATRRRVMAAAEALGYYPNAIARNFARRRSGNIGVILPYVPKVHLFSTFYFSEILNGIGETLRDHGYDMLLLFRSPEEGYDYSLLFKTGRVDACIILGAADHDGERRGLKALVREAFPFCLVNQDYPDEGFPNIDAAHVEGSRSAVLHFMDQGMERIAFINGPLHYSNSRERLDGYLLAFEQRGVSWREEWLYSGNYSRKSGYLLAERLLPEILSGRIEAVFAGNDRMAIGLNQGLKEHGCIAGQHYALIGYDDSDAARLSDPPLTSVHVPLYEMGRLAAERMVRAIDDSRPADGAPTPERLATRLVVRASSSIRPAT